MIRVADVSKTWRAHPGGQGAVDALASVSLTVEDGEFVCLLGPSGCGKSTLLRMIAGLEVPSTGDIVMDGRSIIGQPGWQRGLIFQDYALFPWRTVVANIAFGLEARNVATAERASRCEELIDLVGLRGFEHAYPRQLSGGMQQRVSLARALANTPLVLLMDEPFSSVDALTREALQDELLRIWQLRRTTIIFVTHDVGEALYLADRVIVMSARPGSIRREVRVDVERPRDRDDVRFGLQIREIRKLLADQAARSRFEPSAPTGGEV